MNAAHLHLVINHLPIAGAFLSVPLVAIALWRRNDRGLIIAAALVLTLAAAGSLAALETGGHAEEVVQHLPGTANDLIEVHEERAEAAAWLSLATAVGSLALLGLALRRDQAVPSSMIAALLAATVATSGAMAWTGKAGGVIRHPEIRGDGGGIAAVISQRGDNEANATD
jgi:hypothetical protein